jgi:hypothetical protein
MKVQIKEVITMENELMNYALEILRKRANDLDRTPEQRNAYRSAISIIEYATEGNYECLAQFDY